MRVRANPTQLLPNSPMNDPEYRREHGIVAKPGELVTESASFTRAEWDEMNRLRVAYYIFDNWGVLRYVARYVRQEIGLREVDFYDRVSADVHADPAAWPAIATALRCSRAFMAPPGSWGLFIDEVRRYLTSAARHRRRRRTPYRAPGPARPPSGRGPRVSVGASTSARLRRVARTRFLAREDGHRADWEQVVPSLRTFPAAELTISDPNDICRTDVGKPMGMLGLALRSWELNSAAARPRLGAIDGCLVARGAALRGSGDRRADHVLPTSDLIAQRRGLVASPDGRATRSRHDGCQSSMSRSQLIDAS